MERRKFRMGRSSRKHKIGRWRVEQALEHADEPTADGDALVYVGTDGDGVILEIVLVPDDKNPGKYTCIHAMPIEWRSQ